jgi:hypothetical protein
VGCKIRGQGSSLHVLQCRSLLVEAGCGSNTQSGKRDLPAPRHEPGQPRPTTHDRAMGTTASRRFSMSKGAMRWCRKRESQASVQRTSVYPYVAVPLRAGTQRRSDTYNVTATCVFRILQDRHNAKFITIEYKPLIESLMQVDASQDLSVHFPSMGCSAGVSSSTLRRSRHARSRVGAISQAWEINHS